MGSHIVWIGKDSRSLFSEAEEDFLKRLRPWAKVTLIRLPAASKENLPPAEHKRIEAVSLTQRLKELGASAVYLLDERGKELTSKEFSSAIANHQVQGEDMVFVIGGAYGFDDSLLSDKKFRKIALSKMTLPHHLARLILVEQIYRAFSLINNHPYHK